MQRRSPGHTIRIRRPVAAMNALIFIIVLLFGNADISPAGVAVVWGFLVVVEWLADSFAGWLILHRQSEVTQIS